MTRPRKEIVDLDYCQIYHCITRCVRKLKLLDRGSTDRKQWVRDRLVELATFYAIVPLSFAILGNHLHFMLRIDPDAARGWSPEEVLRRWYSLHPPYVKGKKMLELDPEWLAQKALDLELVEKLRARLMDLGWFMKDLKQPLSRLANSEDGCHGAFFEGRYKSVAVLDELAALMVLVYIDNNRHAAGLSRLPELSNYTSIYERLLHVESLGRTADLQAAKLGSIQARRASEGLEDGLWLMPIEDRRSQGSQRAGLMEGFTLGQYLWLLDETARLQREGKQSLPAETASIFERLNTTAEIWLMQQTLLAKERWRGTFFATSKEKLQDAAAHFGRKRCFNLNGYSAA